MDEFKGSFVHAMTCRGSIIILRSGVNSDLYKAVLTKP